MKAVNARGCFCESDVVDLAKSRILTSLNGIRYQRLPNGINFYGNDRIEESRECHFLIYETLNIETGKYYIGQHKTRNPKDKYLGSGKALKAAVKKHGIDKFIKVILMDCSSAAEMDRCEKSLVTVENCYPNNPKSYNIKEGGYDGAPSDFVKKKQSIIMKGRYAGERNPVYGKKMIDLMGREAFYDMQKRQREHNGAKKKWDELRKNPEKYEKAVAKLRLAPQKRIGIPLLEDHKKHISQSLKAKRFHYYNDGHKEIKAQSCPEGYSPGRLKEIRDILSWFSKKRHAEAVERRGNKLNSKKQEKPKIKKEKEEKQPKARFGYRWWTNGNMDVKSRLCPGEGFSIGRKKASDETRRIMSTHSGSKKMVECMKRENPEKYKEWRKKCSESVKKYKKEHAQDISQNRSKGRWWTDGERNVFSSSPPEGFLPGMIIRKGKNRNIDNVLRRTIEWRHTHDKEA